MTVFDPIIQVHCGWERRRRATRVHYGEFKYKRLLLQATRMLQPGMAHRTRPFVF